VPIGKIIPEPLGGAHLNPEAAATALKSALLEELNRLSELAMEELLDSRYNRYMQYGNYATA